MRVVCAAQKVAGDAKASAKDSAASWGDIERIFADGSVVTSTIEKANRGGVIVRVCGQAGFIPASQIIPSRIGSGGDLPSQLEKLVGQDISALVIQCDKATKQLVLSETQTRVKEFLAQVEVGQEVSGRVESIADFGAFVEIQAADGSWQGVDGLVHISELSWQTVVHPSDVLELGQSVRVKVISVDTEKMRIGLSIRATLPDPLKETLDTLMPIVDDGKWVNNDQAETMPGLDEICAALRTIAGIQDVNTGRQAVEKNVVSQDLQLWITSEPVDDGYNLLARSGRIVQELRVVTTLSRDEMKKAVMKATGSAR